MRIFGCNGKPPRIHVFDHVECSGTDVCCVNVYVDNSNCAVIGCAGGVMETDTSAGNQKLDFVACVSLFCAAKLMAAATIDPTEERRTKLEKIAPYGTLRALDQATMHFSLGHVYTDSNTFPQIAPLNGVPPEGRILMGLSLSLSLYIKCNGRAI